MIVKKGQKREGEEGEEKPNIQYWPLEWRGLKWGGKKRSRRGKNVLGVGRDQCYLSEKKPLALDHTLTLEI